jgi:hypothetical protein
MSQSTETTRPDPLLDAYRQASERDGARAGANVRAAVLAHARVVAQSSGAAVAANGLTDATLATPAANESKPIWRLAAGVVIGLVGVWIFQLTRPANLADTTIAAASAPQSEKVRVVESPSAAAALPEASMATATPTPAAPPPAAPTAVADSQLSLSRAHAGGSRKPAESASAETSVATARAAPPAEKPDLRAPSRVVDNAAATQSTATAADAASNESFGETIVASAELRKSAKVASPPLKDQPAMAAAAPRMAAAAPNAFPAQTAEPPIAATAAPASTPPPPAALANPPMAAATAPSAGLTNGTLAGRSTAAQPSTSNALPQAVAKPTDAARPLTQLGEIDQAMFRAVRSGELAALRAAIARGANVNAKDERGRTTLQIARDRNHSALVDELQAAGAR